MILNNYRTMQRIASMKGEKLTKELIFEVHRSITDDTLSDPSGAGRFRRREERVVVANVEEEVLHTPPPADELEERMQLMCDFANPKAAPGFIHPAVRAMILHFWLAYDHPFIDGNGRTARALYYWSMLHQGYWLCEFISISEIILRAPAKYGRAFLYSETDNNDLTYFIVYHADVVRRAINALTEHVEQRSRELEELEAELRGMAGLNYRQRVLITHCASESGPSVHYRISPNQSQCCLPNRTNRSVGFGFERVARKGKMGKDVDFPARTRF